MSPTEYEIHLAQLWRSTQRCTPCHDV